MLKEQEIAMTPDIEKRFDKIDGHLEKQDERIDRYHSETVKAFSAHELQDNTMHGKIDAHLEQHEQARTQRDNWKIAKLGAIVAIIAALAAAWYTNFLEQRAHRAALQEIKTELKK